MHPCVSFRAMRRIVPLITILLAAGAGTALAQPRPPTPVWDSRGWVPLGDRTVNGRADHDRIEVGKYEGKFGKLTMVVENSDLELLDFKIVFGDRTEYHPRLNHVFREGQRTHAIDLPPGEAVIRFVELRYKNLTGGGDAHVQLWGFRTGDAAPPPAPPAPPPVQHSWDTRGWSLLGQRQVNGRFDHDRIEVGKYEGKFGKLMMAVEDSDLELVDFRIEFDDRTEYHPKLSHGFRDGQRSRAIDLPPSEHSIRFIDIRYRNTRGGGPASVEVWGQRATAPATAPAPSWDPKGWQLLGERTVDGNFDHDRIEVGRYEGKFGKLTIVVENSDLELIDFSIKFGEGAPWHPAVQHFFREGQRTRAIDFPGDERTIKHIDFKYRNLPGGGRARVAVYGLREAPAPAAWDGRGWTMLGEKHVDGHGEDTDRIEVSRWDRKFRKLTVVVLDSDLEMIDLSIKFGRGEPYHPEVSAFFRENTRTKVIDLPGDERAIKWIEFKYRNLPGGGRARVQVWAK
jgi:nitrate reductase NapAB chaperone NapD